MAEHRNRLRRLDSLPVKAVLRPEYMIFTTRHFFDVEIFHLTY